ncbi:hypothetical protein HDU99_002785, partial [Rhizoclosmatium hyalinum]
MANAYGSNCGSALQVTFNTCISNQLTSTTGTSYASTETFCAPYQTSSQEAWYTCLCSAATSVVGCFQSSCPGDAGAASALNAKAGYCAAADAYKPKSTTSAAALITNTVAEISKVVPVGTGVQGPSSTEGGQQAKSSAFSAVCGAFVAVVAAFLV